MPFVRGLWLPNGDTHFAELIDASPIIEGKGTYQLAKYQRALRLCPPDRRRTAVDCGAHVGLWTRVMMIDFAFVHAIEPVRVFRECLAKNVEGKRNLQVWAFALSNKNEMVKLAPPTENSGGAYIDNESGWVEAQAWPLDKFVFENVDFIKIDCEGFEKFVVEGGEETIRRYKPVMVVEQKPGHGARYGLGDKDAVSLLESWGAKVQGEHGGDFILSWA